MDEPSLALIRCFVSVASHHSFARAALQLRMTPSAVSRLVKTLEQQLGVLLIHRTTRAMSLTEAGQHLFAECANALEQIRGACEQVRHQQQQLRGTLKLSAPLSFGRTHVTPHLAAFMRAYPEVKLELLMVDRYVDVVAEGIDIAIRIGHLDDSSLVARKLLGNRRILVAAPSYLAAHGAPDEIEQLKQHECLSLTLNRDGESWRLAGPGGERSLRPSGNMRANNGDAVRQFAVDGLGIAFLSSVTVQQALSDGVLVQILPQWQGRETGVYCVSPSRILSPAAKAMIDFLANCWKSDGAWHVTADIPNIGG
ncbi:LysR family transcriptional regulator [Janthinobacterium agaricidamnosum]|uniref:Bacterial regulatory helix-turn-helix, lysR family protein n=1 Tax=Janthinobacterium agaricidamnosum NBRC 102515 = DSM 9628 TaxID=1349767 RepID=W0V706_9BURK|nr:LysR family transcriptional regulator [Janthinobacterium agaricidamnosum]CDG83385.1 bacterial regulatory helix-turn-helix, lysR family protein [Janthinobacterium agaricidamnosum NBRC 102515 = DSM 9628]